MDSGPTLKPKVTVKLNYDKLSTQNRILSRPASPVKSYASSSAVDATFRPKAKVNSSATTRKTGTSTSTVSGSTSSTPRAGSPTKLTPRVKKPVVSPTPAVSRATLRSPTPVVSAPATPELRKISTASSSLRTEESRSRTGSVSLHHAASFSSFHPSSSSVVSASTAGSGSVSASASPRLMPSKSVMGLAERGQTSSPTLRIRSKVSNLAKAAAESSPTSISPAGSISPPPFPSTRLANPRTGAPSTSSAIGQQQQSQQSQQLSPQLPTSPPPQFYPITTAVPAANPHRFASNRPPAARTSPPTGHHVFQSFSQPSTTSLQSDQISPSSSRPRSASAFLHLNGTATAKVDPASIPLPPHSPPASAVSFSSRSSMSRSSASASHLGPGTESPSTDNGSQRGLSVKQQQQQQQGGPDNLRATLDNLMQYTSGLADDEDRDSGHDRETDGELEGAEEHKVKAAAKSNRKIADLEITNRSLLAINATLEATKHRQAKEIHELRRKLRESRLILPPRAYRDVKSSLGPAELDDDEEDVDDDDDENLEEGVGEGDEIYKRVKLILDTLLKTGQAALERQVKDFPEGGRGAAKVLSPEELKDWRGTNGIDHEQEHEQEYDTTLENSILESETGTQEQEQHRETQEAHVHGQEGDYTPRNEDNDAFFNDVGNETITSEDEVEAMTIPALSPPSSPPPPPILITQPS